MMPIALAMTELDAGAAPIEKVARLSYIFCRKDGKA